MKIHVRIDESNPTHTRMTLFLNGQNCGQLCVGTEDIPTMKRVFANGMNPYTVDDEGDEYVESGKMFYGKEAPCEES